MPAAPAATPPKPSTPATSAITAKIMAHFSMSISFSKVVCLNAVPAVKAFGRFGQSPWGPSLHGFMVAPVAASRRHPHRHKRVGQRNPAAAAIRSLAMIMKAYGT